MSALRVLVAVGTRPEAIKLAPVIHRLRAEPVIFDPIVCATAQHRDMLDAALRLFDVVPDIDLDVMQPGQTPNRVAAAILDRMDDVLTRARPDWVLVQGDTTTALATSLAAFHQHVPVGHVEAGLRTASLTQPFPEEMNRRVIDLVADLRFAPTRRAAAALRGEGVASDRIHVTGNTVVDALEWMRLRLPPRRYTGRLVLVTSHRRESFGDPMRRAFLAIRTLAEHHDDVRFVFPVHPNPAVVETARDTLTGMDNVELRPPADYLELLALLRDAELVITDSGGLQEEAPAFGTPVLVLRERTERPEGVDAGVAVLVGTDPNLIVQHGDRHLRNRRGADPIPNPYGDGRAAARIADLLAGRPTDEFSWRAGEPEPSVSAAPPPTPRS